MFGLSGEIGRFGRIFGNFGPACQILPRIRLNQHFLAEIAEYSGFAENYGQIFGFGRNLKGYFGRTLFQVIPIIPCHQP